MEKNEIPHESRKGILLFPAPWFSRHGEKINPTTSGLATSGRIIFLPHGNIALSDK